MEENLVVLVGRSDIQPTIEGLHDLPAELEALEVSNSNLGQLIEMLDRQFLRKFSGFQELNKTRIYLNSDTNTGDCQL